MKHALSLVLLFFTFNCFSKVVLCETQTIPINQVQGSESESAYVGQEITVKGVVTGDFRGEDALSGFFIQSVDADADVTTSEAIFIHTNDMSYDIKLGDWVQVKGMVSEQFGVTQLGHVSGLDTCQRNMTLPAATKIHLPLVGVNLEQLESMRVSLAEPAVITDLYQYIKYGEMTVSTKMLLAPSAKFRPGEEMNQYRQQITDHQIIIDDGRTAAFSEPFSYGTDGKTPVSENNPLSLGSLVQTTGVLHYAFGKFKIQPTEQLKITASHYNRNLKPQDPGGSLKIATFNIENFFTTIDGGKEICGPQRNFFCRGADSESEYHRQLAKLVAVINAANATVMGVQEFENNDTAVVDLVKALNHDVGFDKWSFIDTGVLGEDVIKVGLIYQAQLVKPVGEFSLLNAEVNPAFKENKNRIVVRQTFVTQNNKKFNVATAHFKSKSCRDAEAENLDQGDGQGCYNAVRTEVAQQVADWLNGLPKHDFTVLVGDLNSYQKEDPINTLQSNGFVNLAEHWLGEENWSTTYKGKVGSLDYIMANKAATERSVGVTQWHINSTEIDDFGYNLEGFKEGVKKPASFYAQSPFSSSDHDLVIAGFNL